VVHHAAKAIATPPLFRSPPVLSAMLLVAALAAASCGSGSSTQPQVGVGPQGRAADQPGRLQRLEPGQHRAAARPSCGTSPGGSVVGNSASSPSWTGSVLDDEKAYELFENYCKTDFARGFKLYKLYERAAAFTGHPQ
jgi:hypothetical protein